ncbi:hypothetical protein PMR38_05525, partial [Bifidobacterium longum]|nr:hypothetical protein [Bifidobacterium longum]
DFNKSQDKYEIDAQLQPWSTIGETMTAKRFIRFYPMTVEPIWPCGLRDFCDVGTPPASQFDSMRHRFPLPNLK